ncbi:MAG: hypothetical protein ABJB05_00170 [Parafilimonas sp.]
MNIKKLCVIVFAISSVLTSCSKGSDAPGNGGNNNGGGGDNGGNNSSLGTGHIYVQWADEGVKDIDLQTAAESTLLPNTTGLHSYYISQDGTKILQSSTASGTDYDANLYTLTNLDGSIIQQFKYYPAEGDYTFPQLSPDATMIAVPPTFDDGVVIMNTSGKVLYNFATINGNKVNGGIDWLPNNELLISTSAGIWHIGSPFKTAYFITKPNFASWGDIAASPDGKKIAFTGGSHIWIMDIDGTNLKQVTTSSTVEAYPVFSPDSKSLLVGTDYQETLATSYIWYLGIIPADGNTYNVDPGKDTNVVEVIPKGETQPQPGDDYMYWR